MSEYKWAAGHNVPFANLLSVRSQLEPHNYGAPNTARFPIGIASEVIDPFPVRDIPLSGVERGDGMVTAKWEMTLKYRAYEHILNTYLGGRTGAVSAPMTIYTFAHETGSWFRANCYLIRPGKEDIEYVRSGSLTVALRFMSLVVI
jgi:hypothetical protein